MTPQTKTQKIVAPWSNHFMDEATLSDGPHVGRGNFHPHVLIKQLGQKNQAVLFIHGDDLRDQTIDRNLRLRAPLGQYGKV